MSRVPNPEPVDSPSSPAAITLIGMAGVGKSTVGQALAQRLELPFIDTDDIIIRTQQKSLKTILHESGLAAFRQIEANTILELPPQRAIISTGGSVVYDHDAMEHLRSFTHVVWLHADTGVILERMGDRTDRGLASEGEKSIEAIIEERNVLYSRYAEVSVECSHATVDDIVQSICQQLESQ